MPIPPIPPSLPGLPKVTGATNGNFSTFTNNGGKVQDSGVKLDDATTTNTNLWSANQIANYVTTSLLNVPTLPNVRAATTANITLTGAQTIDGVALVAGDFVLVKNQTTASQNGFYQVAAGAWVAQKYDTATQAFVAATGVTTYSDLNINGGITFVTSGTTQRNLQYQCAVPIPGAAYPGGSAVNFTAVTKLPIASLTNRFVDASIGNNTNNNGSQAFPFATIPQALIGASFPLTITLSSTIPESSAVTWIPLQSNTIVQGMTSDFTSGMQVISGVQTFSSGGTRNDFKNVVLSTGASAPLVFNSGYLFRNNFENVVITSTAPSWAILPTNAQNFLFLNNIQFTNLGVSNLNLPAFTNPFSIQVSNQLYSPLIFTGTGAANTQITITNCPEYNVQIPPTYLGRITWQNTGLNARVGSVALPGGIITSQAQLTTILNWITDTTYDGNYVISGFTPIANNYANGDVFTKVTVANVITRTFYLRKYEAAPATIASINGVVYQQAAGTFAWVVLNTNNLPGHQYPNVYYVDPVGGLDTDPGTYAQPWLTLQHAAANAPSNSIVYFAPGTYNVPTVVTPANTNVTWEGMDRKTTILQYSMVLPSGKTLNLQNLTSNFGADYAVSGGVLNATGCDFSATLRPSSGGTITLANCTTSAYNIIINAGTFNATNCTLSGTTINGSGGGTARLINCPSAGSISATNTSIIASNCSITAPAGTLAVELVSSSGANSLDLTNVKLFAAGSLIPGSGSISLTVFGGSLSYILNDVIYSIGLSSFGSAIRAQRPVSFDALTLGQALPVASGGTGANALAANGALVSNSAGTAVATVAPGPSGNVLTSNGTNWVSSAPTAGTRVTGTWALGTGNTARSIVLPQYVTVIVSIIAVGPLAILAYNATLTTTNDNVIVLGDQYAYNFNGNGLVWSSLPTNIRGTNGVVINTNAPSPVQTNVLSFSIINNTGTQQTANWSYTIVS